MSNWFTRLFVIPESSAPISSVAVEPVATEIRSIDTAQGGTEKRSFTLQSTEAQRLFAFGAPNLAGVTVNNETTLSLPPAFRAISLIANGIAMLDRKVKKKKDKGVYPADEHPISILMAGRPHQLYTWFDLIAAWVVNGLLGNGYLRIHWDYEIMRPWAIEHIPSAMCWPEFDTYGNLWYRISGELNGRQVSDLVPSTDIMHLKGLTTNGINGKQIALVHQSTIGAGLASKQYSASVFGKSAHPSIALKYDQPLDANERRNAKTNFKAEHAGSDKAGEPIILDDGMSVQYLQWSPVDVALIDFSTLSAEDCCRIWGVPRDFMALDGTGTYGGKKQTSQDLLTHCYGPYIEKIQEEVNTKLFRKSEQGKTYFEFDGSMYLAMDKETEAKTLERLVKSSLLTPNEGRARLGLNPLPGGDDLLGDINMLPLKNIYEVALAKYLSSEGEKARGKETASQSAANTTNPPANNQNDTAHEPAGQP